MIYDTATHMVYAFMAGVLLNLMPCVLPVIPIKVRSVMLELGDSRRDRFLASLAMLSGTLAFFSAVGVLMTVFQMAWGEWFKSVFFTGGVAVLLLAGALVLFLDLPLKIPGFFYSAGGIGLQGAFVAGFMAAILSTPCSGPFLGAVLAWSLMQSTGIVFGVLASVGAGLALPYMVLLWIPGTEKILKRSGPASLVVKYLFSLILYAGFVFYFKAALGDKLPPFFAETMVVSLVVVSGFRLMEQNSIRDKVLNVVTVTIASLVTLILVYGMEITASPPGWHEYDQELVSEAAMQGRPVLLDFTAEWCINCKVLERAVLSRQRVLEKIREKKVLQVRVDLTDYSEDAKKLLVKYGGVAIPHVVIIGGGGDVMFRRTGVFTEKSFLEAMDGL